MLHLFFGPSPESELTFVWCVEDGSSCLAHHQRQDWKTKHHGLFSAHEPPWTHGEPSRLPGVKAFVMR